MKSAIIVILLIMLFVIGCATMESEKIVIEPWVWACYGSFFGGLITLAVVNMIEELTK